ncbi:MAG: SDR family NAD(P)-dependent oxidoreductase [Candidatus Bathyarchaeota archaeon]|nr:SDR family NAD(P)-dependent oxidoreductase [Candidatus Bathyarchaeota archaeon]
MKFRKVLVTGGAGFIGSHIVDELISRGYSIAILDNFHSGKLENLRASSSKNALELIKGDIRDRNILRNALADVDALVHLAALIDVEMSVNNAFETHDVNVTGTLNLLEESVRCGVKKCVLASSAAVYGDANLLPINEECSLSPVSPYAASKVSAEYYCKVFRRCYGLGMVILRYFNVYGPRQKGGTYSGVITRFLENALKGIPLTVYGDGNQTRDFIYVGDVAKATVSALESAHSDAETFNVCTGLPTSINEIAQIVKDVVGTNSKLTYSKPRSGDINASYGDPLKAEKAFGFRARIGLREGIRLLRDSQRAFDA